ncbi:Methylthioribose transporter [Durusdinium trenchii]|uniref:Methylthioribose transporter n=1 Tax=Durusdinium trenchii TaxID=1381693 RepID=A0ABP0NY05_9DINO
MHSLTNVLKRASRTKPIPEEEEDGGLRRCLKTRDVVGLGMGVTVGAGVFMATGKASEEAGPAVVIALLIAAFGCGCTGLCYAEMANLAPSTGSSYSFVYHSAGELPACMVGLTNIINNVMTGAAVSRGWEGYLRALLVTVGAPVPQFLEGFAFGPFEISFLAPLLLGFVIAINLCGTLAVSTFNNVVTVGSITMLLIYVFGGAANVDPDNWDPFMPTGVSGVAHAAGSVFFSYIGFDVLATLSTEATHSRVIPLGIVLTLALSTCLYCCVGGVFTGLIKYTDISKTAPLASAAELRGLRWLALLVAIGALGNTLTTVIGCVLAQPRLCFAMAQQITLTTSQSTGSGVALVHHWKGERDLKTLEMLRDGNFDAVVLQEHSMRSLDEPECMMTHGKLLAEAIKKKKAKVFIFLTWARESWICRKEYNPYWQKKITALYQALATETGGEVVPVGPAWQRARELRPNLPLYDEDQSHPSPLGTYLTACVFYGSFTKKSPVGLPNRLICQGKDGEKIYLNIQSEGVLDHLPNRQTRTGPWTMDSSMDRSMDGLLPSNLVRVNRFGAPARSLLVLSVPALFFALVFDFHKIADVVSVGALCIFSLVCASLILLRCPRALHATGGNSAGAAASHSSNDEEPVRPSMPATRSPRRVIVGLVTFSISIFVLGILFRIPSSSTLAVWLLRGSMAVVILSAAISVFFVCLPFLQSREDTYTWAEQTKRAHGFKLPFMPVPPLIGIMMNVLLISQMSFLTLMEALFLQTVAGAFYFGYSFSRSHLNVTKKTWAPVFASTVPPQEPDDL